MFIEIGGLILVSPLVIFHYNFLGWRLVSLFRASHIKQMGADLETLGLSSFSSEGGTYISIWSCLDLYPYQTNLLFIS